MAALGQGSRGGADSRREEYLIQGGDSLELIFGNEYTVDLEAFDDVVRCQVDTDLRLAKLEVAGLGELLLYRDVPNRGRRLARLAVHDSENQYDGGDGQNERGNPFQNEGPSRRSPDQFHRSIMPRY